ncbi:MAG: ATP synthase F1 subunit gamma [Limnochordia bacterium]
MINVARQSQGDIKRRIKSVKSIEQITRAMELVSVAKLRRKRSRAVAGRPYREKLETMLAHLASLPQVRLEHELLEQREIRQVGYLVVTSDRGYAGGYNNQVLQLAMDVIGKETHPYDLYVVGKKGYDYLHKAGLPIVAEWFDLEDDIYWDTARHIADVFMDAYVTRHVDAIYLIYNEFVSSIVHRPVVKPLLPVEALKELTAASASSTDQADAQEHVLPDYIWEPSPEAVLGILLPRYVETLVYGALSEAQASEYGARMVAMQAATDNAQQMIADLSLSYNQARQASITREITEVIAGAGQEDE